MTNKEKVQGVKQLYSVASLAKLTAQEHESIKELTRKLIGELSESKEEKRKKGKKKRK